LRARWSLRAVLHARDPASAAGNRSPTVNRRPLRTIFGRRSAVSLGGLLVAGLVLAGSFYLAGAGAPAVQQPLRFSHQAHVKLMRCDFCHRLYETQEMAGRPELFRCMLCHAFPVTDNPEAQKLHVLADAGRPIPWIRLTRVAPFVRFSHQRHVVVGLVECRSCHGDIAEATAPPAAPLVPISMQMCLDCHRASTLQLSSDTAQALSAQSPAPSLLEALKAREGKRFRSGEELLAGLTRESGAPPTDEQRRVIISRLHPAPPVTTDCFACHR
jgi:hypothetical protein